MIRIIHISDLHYQTNYNKLNCFYKELMPQLLSPFVIIDELLKEYDKNVDLLIVSGDLCENGSVDDYRMVKKQLEERFNCPIIYCYGNHDNKSNMKAAIYGDRNALDNSLWQNDKLQVLSIDSSNEKYPDGFILDDTIDYAIEKLQTGKNTIIVTHHHLLQNQFTMQRASGSDKFLSQIKKYDNLKGIVTGHTHHFFHTMIDEIPYYTVGSCSFLISEYQKNLRFYQKTEINYYEVDDTIKCQRIRKDSLDKYIGIVVQN